MKNDPIKKMEQYMRERKKIQKGNEKMYNHAQLIIKEELDNNQGTDIIEKMLAERREWVA